MKTFMRMNPWLNPWLVLALSGTLAACAGKPASPGRDPASTTLLQGCGHAPFRQVIQNGITLRPKFTRAGSGYLLTRTPCTGEGCSGFEGEPAAQNLSGRHNSDNFHDRSDIARFDWKSETSGYAAGQAIRVGSFQTNGYASHEVEIHPAVLREIPAGETSPPPTKYDSPTVEFVHWNRDLTFREFMQFASPHFDVVLDKLDCPLSRAQQAASCENGRVPYDPGEEFVTENAKSFFKSKKFKNSSVGERKDAKQNSRGYSYLIHYQDRNGNVVEDSKTNRFTPNAYRLFQALTRPLCPDWKISYVALNAHNGKNPYAKWLDETGERQTTARIEAIAYRDRADEIIRNYAEGTDVILNLCFSLSIDDAEHQSRFGDVLVKLDPARNPVRSVKGYSGTCYTMSHRADSGHVPLWVGKFIKGFQKRAEQKAQKKEEEKAEREHEKKMNAEELAAYRAQKKKAQKEERARKEKELARASPRPTVTPTPTPRLTAAEQARLDRERKIQAQEDSDYAAVGTDTWMNPRFK